MVQFFFLDYTLELLINTCTGASSETSRRELIMQGKTIRQNVPPKITDELNKVDKTEAIATYTRRINEYSLY